MPDNQWADVLAPQLSVSFFLQVAVSDAFFVTLIGSIAASLTTSSFLPQIFQGYRTKKMQDVSLYLMVLYAIGTTLWLVYGVFKNDCVIIGANALAASFNLILLYMKYIYRRTSSLAV